MVSGSATVQPAWWLCFLMLGWALAIEVASRTVVPGVVPFLPPALVRRLGPSLPSVSPARPPTTGPEPETPSAPPALPPEWTPEQRARAVRIGVLAGAVLLVVVTGTIVISVVNKQRYSAEDTAAAYLDALVDGDVDRALELAPVDADEAGTDLLTDEVYAESARPSGYELGEVSVDGDHAQVDIELHGLDDSPEATLSLTRVGNTGVFFDDWRVDDSGLAFPVDLAFPESVSTVSVNNVALEVEPNSPTYWALPGAYTYDPYAGNPWPEADAQPQVLAGNVFFGAYLDVPEVTASQELRDQVDQAIQVWLDHCMAATELEPDGCPQSVYAGTEARNVQWTLERAPTVDYDFFDGALPAELSTDEPGEASVSYEYDASYGFGNPDWEDTSETTSLYFGILVDEADGELQVNFDTY